MSAQASSGGIGFLGVLGIVFITLKLTENIDWSWWWVTAPLWGGFALAGVIITVIGVAFGVGRILDWIRSPTRHSRGRNPNDTRGRW